MAWPRFTCVTLWCWTTRATSTTHSRWRLYDLVAASKTFSFQFEITFECIEDLPEDLEWKIIYVGSAESEEFDQVLDTVYVGPVPEGRHMFVFQVTLSKC